MVLIHSQHRANYIKFVKLFYGCTKENVIAVVMSWVWSAL